VGAAVSHSCACIGSPCLSHCVHGASIGDGGEAGRLVTEALLAEAAAAASANRRRRRKPPPDIATEDAVEAEEDDGEEWAQMQRRIWEAAAAWRVA
jgi:hypothetical protein